MSYRCQACGQACSGQMIRHVEYRETAYAANVGTPNRPKFVQKFKRQIAREIPVCAGCMTALCIGMTIGQLQQLHRPLQKVVEYSAPDAAAPPSSEKKTGAPDKQDAQLPDLFG